MIGRCYATRAEGRPTDEALVDLAVAHDFNPDDRVLDRVRAPLVATATAWGRSADAAGNALGHVRRGRCAEATASAGEVGDGPWRDAHQAELDAAVAACAPLEGAVPEMSELERLAWAEAFARYQQPWPRTRRCPGPGGTSSGSEIGGWGSIRSRWPGSKGSRGRPRGRPGR